tara:strand:+ start:811 stop:1374 length:564 start_codon:yes stop_codon:yes gene_type:complete
MKKQLLQESEIRKMMKFANIGALTDGFVTKLHEQEMMGDEEEEGAEDAAEEPEAEGDTGEEDEMGMMGGEEEDDAGSEVVDAVEDLIADLKRALEAAGPEGAAAAGMISVEGGDDEMMAAADDDAGADPMTAMGEGSLEEIYAEGDGEVVTEVELEEEEALQEEIMEETLRRVARRLNLMERRSRYL